MGMEQLFFNLIKLGIGHYAYPINKVSSWDEIIALAARQGLSAVLIDGVEKLPIDNRPPKEILLQWIGETLHNFEYRYKLYVRAITEMATFYNSNGYKMMVLKGYACAKNWPKPEHRPCGDIDIWQFGKQKEADALLAKEKSIKIDSTHHHHTVFYWRDFMVENHYDFINIHHNKSNPELERIFKKLGQDDSHYIELYGEKVYVPSPNLHALFLLRHAINHFASSEITIRQLMDWGFFVEKNGKYVDWDWMNSIIDRFGMSQLYGIFNAICVEDLGFDATIFSKVIFNPSLKERVIKEIITPRYSNEMPTFIIRRIVYKYSRWKDNKWKRELCYNESNASSLWSGILAHLLKPKTI